MGRKRNDILWKSVIEDFFSEFLHFFSEELVSLIDFSKDFQFLDKEVAELFPGEDPEHPKVVDKLVKVYLKSGKEQWFLIHIEVQGYREDNFAERMFRYFYRLYDKFKVKVSSIVIFLGKSTRANTKPFVYAFNGTSLIFDYKRYYIGDQQAEALERSGNPFALIIHTGLIGLNQKLRDEELFQLKYRLVKKLYTINLSKEKIRRLLVFLSAYLRFEDSDLSIKFAEQTEKLIIKNTPMGIIEQVRELDLKEGEKRGERRALLRTARRLLKNGIDISLVHECTGLSMSALSGLTKKRLPGALKG